MNDTIVRDEDVRPARMDGTCFYCSQAIGKPHIWECVIPQKKVRLRVTLDYETTMPRSWDRQAIEFHRNDSSWCANNIVPELELYTDPLRAVCLCHNFKCQYLGDVEDSGPLAG